jgi:hypothetical protein
VLLRQPSCLKNIWSRVLQLCPRIYQSICEVLEVVTLRVVKYSYKALFRISRGFPEAKP